jgi:hypothetical protein
MFRAGLRLGQTARLLVTLAVAGYSTTIGAQEVRAISEEIHQFTSPMVLEMSLDPLLDKPVGEKWSTDKTKVFSCRGVTIESMEFRVLPDQKTPYKKIEVLLRLNNNSGKDKRANVQFQTSEGGEIAFIGGNQVKLEQGDNVERRMGLYLVPPEKWNQPPRPKLRVVLTLQDY